MFEHYFHTRLSAIISWLSKLIGKHANQRLCEKSAPRFALCHRQRALCGAQVNVIRRVVRGHRNHRLSWAVVLAAI